MSKRINGFNLIANVYDLLARIVFGNSIRQSQEHFLHGIIEHKKVLILGGGSGWILESIAKTDFKGEVWYIEASSEMIVLSRKKQCDGFEVHFIHGTEDDIPEGVSFDMVITNFYLDLFSPDKLGGVIEKITAHLPSNAAWLVTDFVNTKSPWHKFLLRTMYFFFGIMAGIEARSLTEWQPLLRVNGVVVANEKTFYNGFIKTAMMVYLPAM